MKAIIVSSSYSYVERIELLKEGYEKKGYETIVILTDFIHASKKYVSDEREGFIYIKTKPYIKNISPQRLYSHYQFAKDAFKRVREYEVDLLHVLIPANALAKEANRYKKNHPDVKLYMDFIDLWPETMPIKYFKNAYPFKAWKNLRDKNLENTDAIYCECDLYREVLEVTNNNHYKTLYWAKKAGALESHPELPVDHINLCYLGSINNIIDMDLIVEICNRISVYKDVTLHIVGIGEKKDEFLQLLEANGVNVQDYGAIYDDRKKQQIFDQCHFGLNIMKSTVCVGLTMKSLDYFKAQLPIINNIKGDTFRFVKEYRVGFNVEDEFVSEMKCFTQNDYLQMRNRVKQLYQKKFTKDAFFEQMI